VKAFFNSLLKEQIFLVGVLIPCYHPGAIFALLKKINGSVAPHAAGRMMGEWRK
jgi:hypothetical protein